MRRLRHLTLPALLPLALIGCALSDDFAIAPAPEGVESTGGRAIGASGGRAGGGGLGEAGASDVGGEPSAGERGSDSGCIPAREICDGVSNDCDDEIDEGAECPTDCSIRSYDGHLYGLCLFPDEDEWVTHPEATTACTKLATELGS